MHLDNMDKEKVAIEEILSQMRQLGYEELKQIKWIVLEPDGKLSFIPQEPKL